MLKILSGSSRIKFKTLHDIDAVISSALNGEITIYTNPFGEKINALDLLTDLDSVSHSKKFTPHLLAMLDNKQLYDDKKNEAYMGFWINCRIQKKITLEEFKTGIQKMLSNGAIWDNPVLSDEYERPLEPLKYMMIVMKDEDNQTCVLDILREFTQNKDAESVKKCMNVIIKTVGGYRIELLKNEDFHSFLNQVLIRDAKEGGACLSHEVFAGLIDIITNYFTPKTANLLLKGLSEVEPSDRLQLIQNACFVKLGRGNEITPLTQTLGHHDIQNPDFTMKPPVLDDLEQYCANKKEEIKLRLLSEFYKADKLEIAVAELNTKLEDFLKQRKIQLRSLDLASMEWITNPFTELSLPCPRDKTMPKDDLQTELGQLIKLLAIFFKEKYNISLIAVGGFWDKDNAEKNLLAGTLFYEANPTLSLILAHGALTHLLQVVVMSEATRLNPKDILAILMKKVNGIQVWDRMLDGNNSDAQSCRPEQWHKFFLQQDNVVGQVCRLMYVGILQFQLKRNTQRMSAAQVVSMSTCLRDYFEDLPYVKKGLNNALNLKESPFTDGLSNVQ